MEKFRLLKTYFAKWSVINSLDDRAVDSGVAIDLTVQVSYSGSCEFAYYRKMRHVMHTKLRT